MLRKALLFSFYIIFVLTPLLVSAHSDHNLDVDTVLENIKKSQSVINLSDVNCDKVTDEQFENLGDAWMEQMHPGEIHEFMDERMGGKNLDNLRSMHIQMGKNYLGCNGGMPGMMGMMMNGSMMGNFQKDNSYNPMNSYGSMMGFSGMGLFPGILFFSFWTLIIVILVALVRFLWVRADKK